MKQLVIVEDHPMFLEKLAEIFSSTGSYNIVLTAPNSTSLLDKLATLIGEVDLFILDLNLPDLDGISLAKKIKHLDSEAKIVAFSQFYSKALEISTKSAGIMKILSKNLSRKDFLESINCLLNPIKPAQPLNRIKNLSERQTQVIAKIAEGKTVNQIAKELFISPETIKSHKKEIMRKLNINRIADLIKYSLAINIKDIKG
jgi:DNA-binding NarL/FixJ family response regulator